MADRTAKEAIEAYGAQKLINYVDKDPETNIPKIIDWVDKHMTGHDFHTQIQTFRNVMDNPDYANWHDLLFSLWDKDNGVRRAAFENFIINATVIGCARQDQYKAKYDCNIPWAILMDPTSACNLHCTGCWAAEYGNKLNMTYDELDDIINQGNELGTFMYIYSGGEPLVRKADIIKLCEAHPDNMFLAFTNGTLIDEQFAEDMVRVKNFIPAISLEGNEETTDARRGKGTYQKIMRAIDILNEHKLVFGFSCCYTAANTEVIGSEENFDDMVKFGAMFAWFFTYMPVGKNAPTDLLASAEQREYMYHQIRKFRWTKPIFTLDFWNDGEFVNGCIAGGRNFLHINANGDIEPCAFTHYSDSNIRQKTLIETYTSPLFQLYHKEQPFNENQLRPCPLLDNPGRLAQLVEDAGAHSTDLLDQENVEDLCEKCHATADRWAVVADELWSEDKTTSSRIRTEYWAEREKEEEKEAAPVA